MLGVRRNAQRCEYKITSMFCLHIIVFSVIWCQLFSPYIYLTNFSSRNDDDNAVTISYVLQRKLFQFIVANVLPTGVKKKKKKHLCLQNSEKDNANFEESGVKRYMWRVV